MQDLIKTLNLEEGEQTFLPLKDNKWLSIVLEKNYLGIDENGKCFISNRSKPLGLKLSCAIQSNGINVDFLCFHTEEDFYKFMSENTIPCAGNTTS
jgi:hypothetical protein